MLCDSLLVNEYAILTPIPLARGWELMPNACSVPLHETEDFLYSPEPETW
jgi:hypothetical protein